MKGATPLISIIREPWPVSIHAPVKGATSLLPDNCNKDTGFNPRAREGRDLRTMSRSPSIICFNPRAREGRDVGNVENSYEIKVSIHAPVKGATLLDLDTIYRDRVSIHAPVKGATSPRPSPWAPCRFQSTRP